jgi:hypothetical protein
VATAVAVAFVLVGGVVLRFWTRSDLWFDEALTVDIARLPVGDVLRALAHDGHPPLYYVLLHYWMALVGQGDLAVRSLSGVFAVAALPLAWILGRRLGGRPAALATLLVLASSPFAMRYATEARMYTLVMFLVLADALALGNALRTGDRRWQVAVAVLTGLLLLSHYWAFYVVASTLLVLAWAAWRAGGDERRARFGALVAVAAGGLLFLPWLPTFLEQAATTGTPWGGPARPAELATSSLIDFGGGPFGEARLLGALSGLLVLLALLAKPVDGTHIELDLYTRPRARPLVAVIALTLALSSVASWLTASATTSRYLSVVFPLHVVLVGLGVTVFTSPRVRAAVLATLVVLGAVGGAYNVTSNRTQGVQIARAIEAGGHDGDLVAFCPDQLGPATVRHLHGRFDLVTFPDFGDPERIDWQHYAARQQGADAGAFASRLVERSDGRTIWLAWAGGHRSLGRKCETVASLLGTLRPMEQVVTDVGDYEHGWLYRYAG